MGEKHRFFLLRLLAAHYNDVLGYLTARTGSATLAADAMQDTYLRLRTTETIPDLKNPRGYLLRVAHNIATDHVRQSERGHRRHTGIEAFHDLPDGAPSAEAEIYRHQRALLLSQALEGLPPRCREAFLLHKFDGLSHSEVAQKLGISRSAVEKHVMRALAHCRDTLADRLN